MLRFCLIVLGLLCLAACDRGPKRTFDNVVLITLDTTRADALGAYGNKRVQTPNLDALANQGHLFEQCYTHAPITLPSHSSILTGKIPTQHGVHNNISYALSAETPTLASLLKEQGYATGAFISSFILDSKFGLDKGFDVYEDEIVHYSENAKKNEIVTRRAGTTIDLALKWLGKQDGPFFSWIHFYDAHWPYTPPLPFRQAYAEQPYLGEIAYMDVQIGRLVKHLKDRGLYEKTLIVITADHGESFSEHGEQTHGFFCYGATTHVPLILNHPIYDAPGTRFKHRVQSVDLMPSILQALDQPRAKWLDGTILQSRKVRQVYSEAIIPHEDFYLAPVHGLKDDKYSFYYSSKLELYDLVADPNEKVNLAEQLPKLTTKYELKMKDLLRLRKRAADTTQLDQESIELLRSLGYIADGGSFNAKDSDPYKYRSPYESIKIYRELMHLRQFEDVYPYKMIEGLRTLIEKDRRQIILYRDLGRLSAFAGNEEESIDSLKKAAHLKPDDPRLHVFLALAYHRFGRFEESVEELEVALKLNPANATAHYNLGVVQLARDKTDAAVRAFEATLEHNPRDAFALNNLAYIYLHEKKDIPGALDFINQAEAINPKHPLIQGNKADILAAQ